MTQPGDEIAQHPYFGSVTAENRKLVFQSPSGRADAEYWAQTGVLSPHEEYEALASRLPAFETFCRRINENDRLVRDHFGSWPPSAGAFALIGAVINGNDPERRRQIEEVRRHIPDFPTPPLGLMLRYRAQDEEAWNYAGITWYPPVFSAYFDEADGTFLGFQQPVDARMRTLPETIVRSRFEDAYYRHSFFGRRKLNAPFFTGSISRLGAAVIAGRKVPLELYVNKRDMAAFEPEMLDRFVRLAERLAALDALVKADFPAKERVDWLALRYAPENYGRVQHALERVFPGATAAEQVTAPSFAAALSLRRACFSLSPQDSGGSALTLEYHLLPQRLDNYLFAAKFSEDGTLREIVVES